MISSLWGLYVHYAMIRGVLVFIGGIMLYAPIFSSPTVFVRVKIFLAFIIGLAVYPMVSARFPGAMPSLELWSLVPLVGAELLVGIVIGFVASLPLLAVQTGGLGVDA